MAFPPRLLRLCGLPLLLLAAFSLAEQSEEESAWGHKFLHNYHAKRWIMSRPELEMPPEYDACREPVNLTMMPAEIEDPFTHEKVFTRSFNGIVPGPTIRVKPGCTINLSIDNKLGKHNPNCEETGAQPNSEPIIGNWTCFLNTTNIHTHGLHVTSNFPGDRIFTQLKPQSKQYWAFALPANHHSGTNWYHPHVHHATASQAGGGAAGAIIVEDPEGSVPEYVKKMEEKILIFFNLDFQLQSSVEYLGMGTYFWQTSSKTNTMLVNGQHQPKITMKSGKWYRFRMVFSAIESLLQMTNKGTAWCATKLLAKDGVWLTVTPRDLRGLEDGVKPIPIQLGPGNRADIAIACTCPFPKLGCYSEFYSLQNCTAENVTEQSSVDQVIKYNNGTGTPDDYTPCDPVSSRRRRGCEGVPMLPLDEVWGPLDPGRCGFGYQSDGSGKLVGGPSVGSPMEDAFYSKKHGLDHGLLDVFNGTIFSIVVKPSAFRRWWHPAWQFEMRRPCYLVDLRNAEIEYDHQRRVEFYGPIFPNAAAGFPKAGPISSMYTDINAEEPDYIVKFEDPPTPSPYGPGMPIGSAVQWRVGGIGWHPFHLHITPYQLQNMTGYPPDPWFQEGDWHDVIVTSRAMCLNSTSCPLDADRIEGGGGVIFVRFWTDTFTGQYIAHCHLLTHEDEGMMLYFNTTGEEGVTPPQARKLDPSCYLGHLRDAKPSWGWKWHGTGVKGGIFPEQKPRRLRSARRRSSLMQGETDVSAYLQERPGAPPADGGSEEEGDREHFEEWELVDESNEEL